MECKWDEPELAIKTNVVSIWQKVIQKEEPTCRTTQKNELKYAMLAQR